MIEPITDGAPDDPSRIESPSDEWARLVTAAIVGTDRRVPPPVSPGPIADVVADSQRPDPATRLLTQVAATVAARRAGLTPRAAVALTGEVPADERPWCPVAAVMMWRRVIDAWPVLEPEWLVGVIDRQWQLPPDALVELLARHRRDQLARARVVIAAGPRARWLVSQFPSLGSTAASRVGAAQVRTLAELPIPPDLRVLIEADGPRFVAAITDRIASGAWGASHRAVLVNLIARCRPEVLGTTVAALEPVQVPLAGVIADVARMRAEMLAALDGRAGPPG